MKENKSSSAKCEKKVNETFLKLQASLNASWKPNNAMQSVPKIQRVTGQTSTSDDFTPKEMDEMSTMTAAERLRYRRKRLQKQANAKLEADAFLAEVNENIQKKNPSSNRIVKETLPPSQLDTRNGTSEMESVLKPKLASATHIKERAKTDPRALTIETDTKEVASPLTSGSTTRKTSFPDRRKSPKRGALLLSEAVDRNIARGRAEVGVATMAFQEKAITMRPTLSDRNGQSKAFVSLANGVKPESATGNLDKREIHQEPPAYSHQHINATDTSPDQPASMPQPNASYPHHKMTTWNAFPPPVPIYHPYGMYPAMPIAAFPMSVTWPSNALAYQSITSVKLDRCDHCRGVGLHLVHENGLCAHCHRLQVDSIAARAKMRQQCAGCNGWGLGLLESNGKCGHCNRVENELISIHFAHSRVPQIPRDDFSDSSSDWDSFSSECDS